MRILIAHETVSSVVDDAVVILTPDMRFLQLDSTAGEMWEMLRDGAGVDEVSCALADRYDVARDVALTDTITFVQHLADEGVVTIHDP